MSSVSDAVPGAIALTNPISDSIGGAASSRYSGVSAVIANLLEEAVGEGTLPGGVVQASKGSEVVAACAVGNKLLSDEARELKVANEPISFSTVFDLGQLTQAICPATLMMRLVSAGKISVTDRASRFLQALGVGSKSLNEAF